MNTTTLIAQAPAEIILGLVLFFTVAAIVLLALSAEAGNYRDVSRDLRTLRRTILGVRPRRRWMFNTGRADKARARRTHSFPAH